jgi:hypothetical protein
VKVLGRAEVVRQRILEIKGDLVKRALELGALLLEARSNDYHVVWGHTRFGDWVEASDLDMSERQAYYLIQIVERSRALGITQEQLEAVKLTKLKEIFALKAAPDEVIKQLVEEAQTCTLEELRGKVQALRQGAEDDIYTFLNLDLKGRRLPRAAKDSITKAFEDVRRSYGSTVNSQGEVDDIPDWRVLELLCVEYMEDPNRTETQGEVIEAEFTDLPKETPEDDYNAS